MHQKFVKIVPIDFFESVHVEQAGSEPEPESEWELHCDAVPATVNFFDSWQLRILNTDFNERQTAMHKHNLIQIQDIV
jgi:hypothetical protein